MESLMERVNQRLQLLPTEKQQEVLDFIDFLHTRENKSLVDQEPISVYEAAHQWIGCLEDGPEDLSSNKKYLEGFGR